MIRSENRIREVVRLELLRMLRNKVEWGPTSFSVFFMKQKKAYEILAWLEFRRVLFRSSSSTAFHGSVSSTCSTPSVARKAIFFPLSLSAIGGSFPSKSVSLFRTAGEPPPNGMETGARSEERRVG